MVVIATAALFGASQKQVVPRGGIAPISGPGPNICCESCNGQILLGLLLGPQFQI
jgi:hypothetical protein